VRTHVTQPAEFETPDVAIEPLPPVVEEAPPVVVDPTLTPTHRQPPKQLRANCPIVGGGPPPLPSASR
jgi:hypothetical protein